MEATQLKKKTESSLYFSSTCNFIKILFYFVKLLFHPFVHLPINQQLASNCLSDTYRLLLKYSVRTSRGRLLDKTVLSMKKLLHEIMSQRPRNLYGKSHEIFVFSFIQNREIMSHDSPSSSTLGFSGVLHNVEY